MNTLSVTRTSKATKEYLNSTNAVSFKFARGSSISDLKKLIGKQELVDHVELPTWIVDQSYFLGNFVALGKTLDLIAPRSLNIYQHMGGRLSCKAVSTLLYEGIECLTIERSVNIFGYHDAQALSEKLSKNCHEIQSLSLLDIHAKCHDDRPLLDPLFEALCRCEQLEHFEIDLSLSSWMSDCIVVDTNKLRKFLRSCSKIKTLSFHGLQFSEMHLMEILDHVPPSLEVLEVDLDIGKLMASNESSKKLVDLVLGHKKLEHLSIPSLSFDERLIPILKDINFSLKSLHLNSINADADFWLQLNRLGRSNWIQHRPPYHIWPLILEKMKGNPSWVNYWIQLGIPEIFSPI